MRSVLRASAALALLSVLVVVPGCGRGDDKDPGELSPEDAGLVELADVYKYLAQKKMPPPGKLEDLRPYETTLSFGWAKLERGEYVVFWGSGLASTPEAGRTVLVYEKKVPTEGGNVILRDGTVKRMTPDEFRAAPKAGK
jgi:hypothetical protein